jgi:hypothetical protein
MNQAFEDGPDRGFRNVGKSQSDAGEILKRTHTKVAVRCSGTVTNCNFSDSTLLLLHAARIKTGNYVFISRFTAGR